MDKRLRHIALLRCFAAAAKYESYSQAAQRLAITQAAVSQQIRSLEEVLAVKLFVRHGRSMRLTPQGKTLYQHVNDAFTTLSAGFDKVQVEPAEGVLNVTTGLSFASIWLVPKLWKFSARYPDIKVKIIVSTELESLRYSDIDVAIRQGDATDHRVHQETLFIDPVFAVCAPQLVETARIAQPADLLNCLLVEAEDPGRFSWANWFSLSDLTIPRHKRDWLEVSTLEMGINAVLAGQGICLASYCLVKDLINSGLLVRPFPLQIEPGQRFSLLYDPNSPRKPRIDIFTDWLKQELIDDGIVSPSDAGQFAR